MRTDVAFAIQQFGMSERQACKLVKLDRSSYRYEPLPDHNAQLREELVEPRASEAALRLPATPRAASQTRTKRSPQRVYRVYKREGLAVRRLRRKRLSRPVAAVASSASSQPGMGTGLCFWPMVEQNSSFWLGGALGGKEQTFITPGLVLGGFPIEKRLRFAVGAGYQIAVTPFRQYNHRWILSLRFPF